MLDRLDELTGAGVAGDGPAVRLAAWFHDGVYDGERGDEDRSAVWAEEALADTAHAAEVAPAGAAHRAPRPRRRRPARPGALRRRPGDPGRDRRTRYDAYVAGVRRDYAHVSDPDFAAGRAAVLRDLAGRARLFHTAYAREHWEPLARANLARELGAGDGAARLSPAAQV